MMEMALNHYRQQPRNAVVIHCSREYQLELHLTEILELN